MDKQVYEWLTTIRWHSTKALASEDIESMRSVISAQKDYISQCLGESPLPEKEPDRPDPGQKGAGAKLIPFAHQNPNKMHGRGPYPKGYPVGAVIHFTSGHSEKGLQDAINCVEYGRGMGYAYLCIATTGEIVQAHEVDEWGSHCGESQWPGLGSSLSNQLIGIEMCNGSRLEKLPDGRFKSWFGTYFTADQVRYVPEGDSMEGWYQKYTPEQEKALLELLLFLKHNDPTGNTFQFDNCLGHDEIAGKKGLGRWRKNDPGGALSMEKPAFRDLLKKKYAERYP